MRSRLFVSTIPLAMLALAFGAKGVFAQVVNDSNLPSSQFDLVNRTQVPGSTLSPGHYAIHVLDHLTDRMVVQIDSEKGKPEVTFIGLPNAKLAAAGKIGVIAYGNEKNAALRGFEFGNGTTLEFVYPKAQAVAIARLNSTKVPAVDPASDGFKSQYGKLTHNDFALVTLWLLSPTFVGSESKPSGVLAQRYQEPASQPSQNAQTEPAQANSAPPVYRSQDRVKATPPQPVMMAQAGPRKPVLARLPHTAGSLPMIWLLGFMSLLSAIALSTMRIFKAASEQA